MPMVNDGLTAENCRVCLKLTLHYLGVVYMLVAVALFVAGLVSLIPMESDETTDRVSTYVWGIFALIRGISTLPLAVFMLMGAWKNKLTWLYISGGTLITLVLVDIPFAIYYGLLKVTTIRGVIVTMIFMLVIGLEKGCAALVFVLAYLIRTDRTN